MIEGDLEALVGHRERSDNLEPCGLVLRDQTGPIVVTQDQVLDPVQRRRDFLKEFPPGVQRSP
jgi:hypothetical protein